MIGYVTIGSNDLELSRRFYDAILAPLGARIIIDSPKMKFYAAPGGATMLAISTPYDKGSASAGNGSMFGVPASSNALVEEIYAIAMDLGAVDEGAPGYRTPEIYISYFRDPFDNKVAIYNLSSMADFAAGAPERARAKAALEAQQNAG